jgi:Outer membrane protein beta-barrel domain
MPKHCVLRTLAATLAWISFAAAADAQTSVPRPWSVEVGLGFDNSISGNINSSATGTLNAPSTTGTMIPQTVVILKNRYEDVYGTGLNLRFGGGYMLNEATEIKGIFTFQSLDADLTSMGDLGLSNLYGQYSDYQSFGLDVGLRRYAFIDKVLRPYGEGMLGIGFVDKTDVTLVAPQANVTFDNNDFYDQTAAFSFAGNAGVLWQLSSRLGAYAQLGVRFVSGMSEVDDLEGTGLDTINDNSSRWTIPFVVGFTTRF